MYLQFARLAFLQLAHRHAEEWLHSDDYRSCIDFDEFQKKLKRQTFWNQDLPLGGPRSLSLRMLYLLPGIGKEAAQPIIAMHPTLAEVIGALTANGNELNDITTNNGNGSSSSSSSSSSSANNSSSSGSVGAGVGCEGREGMLDDHPIAGAHAGAYVARAIGDSRTPTKRSKPTATTTAAITPSPRIPTNTNVPLPTKKRKAGPEPLVFPSCGPHKNNVLKTFFYTYF